MASRLRAAGIAARVDRGLHGSAWLAARGQITVVVDERYAKRAAEVVGVPAPREVTSVVVLRAGMIVVAGALVLGLVAIVATLSR